MTRFQSWVFATCILDCNNQANNIDYGKYLSHGMCKEYQNEMIDAHTSELYTLLFPTEMNNIALTN
jgi:hypothetical protein